MNFSRCIILFLFLFSACSTKPSRQKLDSQILQSDCDQALFTIGENQKTYQIASITKQAGGKLISYSFTGAAYAVQILWDSTVVISSAIILCAPMIALSAATTMRATPIGNGCFSGDISPLMAPKLGRSTFDQTQKLRCPNVTELSQSIRSVAQCYYHKGGAENIRKAISTLESIKSSEFYSCLPTIELNEFTKDLYHYKSEPQFGGKNL